MNAILEDTQVVKCVRLHEPSTNLTAMKI